MSLSCCEKSGRDCQDVDGWSCPPSEFSWYETVPSSDNKMLLQATVFKLTGEYLNMTGASA